MGNRANIRSPKATLVQVAH